MEVQFVVPSDVRPLQASVLGLFALFRRSSRLQKKKILGKFIDFVDRLNYYIITPKSHSLYRHSDSSDIH